MLGTYYVADTPGKLIYLAILSEGEGVTTGLYINDALVDNNTTIVGTFELQKDEVRAEVVHSLTGSRVRLQVKGQEFPMTKTGRKELRAMLQERNLFNRFNPSEQARAADRFRPQVLIFPLVLLLIGCFVYSKIGHDARTLYKVISFVALLPGPFVLFHTLSKWLPFLSVGKVALALSLGAAIGLTILMDRMLFGTFDISALYDQLGTEKSVRLKVPVTGVDFQDVVYYKGSAKNKPYYKHYYSFSVNGKTYEGSHTNPEQEYSVGDSLEVYYLLSDPRINKSVENIAHR